MAELNTTLNCSIKKRRRRAFLSTEKTMICNMFHTFKEATPSASHNDICKTVASTLGVHWVSIYKVIIEQKNNGGVKSPKKKRLSRSILDKIDDFTKCAIRHMVHIYFLKNEIPTLNKILIAVNDDGTLGSYKRTTMYNILKNIGFKFNKRSRNSLLVDRDDIFFWRRNYLRKIKETRQKNQKIYYLDETWINEGHTTAKAWVDTTVKSKRDAFIKGLSTGLKNPSGKGKRLIITHIGSEDGFLEGGLLVFESKKQGDYHQDMNSQVFENWFSEILDKLEDNCVIVMDNASYHSRKQELVPTQKNKKQEIIDWLKEKGIPFLDDMLKRELLKIVKCHRERYEARVTDEMAKAKNKTVLRLPPYHCELNPIELIWAQMKGYVASHNKTFKMTEVKKLMSESIAKIDSEKWKNCIKHVIEVVEPRMNEMDRNVEVITERFIINVGRDSSSDTSETE